MSSQERALALVMLPDRIGAAAAAARVYDVVIWENLPDRASFIAERAADVQVIVTASTIPLPAPLSAFPRLSLLAFFGAGYAMSEMAQCRARWIASATGRKPTMWRTSRSA